jgi:hypothetical protein
MDTLAHKIVARFLSTADNGDHDFDDDDVDMVTARFDMLREHYLPPEAREEKPLHPEGTDLEIYVWDGEIKDPRNPEGKGLKRFYAAAFAGKSQKPLWHIQFRTQSNRIEEIRKTIEARKQVLESKRQRQEEKNNFVHGLKPGDIMVCSWGYDQTNIDYYQVTEVRGKNVVLREISKKVVGDSGGSSERVMPVPDSFIGEPLLKRPSGSSGKPYVRVTSYSSAHLWDGKPDHQTGPYSGH